MTPQPKIQVPLTTADRLLEGVALLLLLGSWVYAFVMYPKLPETIAIHFDGQGNPDGYGGKIFFWGETLAGTALYALLTFLGRHPEWFNYPVAITSNNAPRLYHWALQMMRSLKVVLVGIFAAIQWQTVQVALRPDFSGTSYVIGGILLALFGTIFYYLIQLFKQS